MGAHIFLVGEDNFKICRQKGVYGCVVPLKEWNKAEIIAGILSVKLDDLVFFYVKNKGVYGVWKVINEPFFDETKVWENEDQRYPFRISFVPTIAEFHQPIILSDIFDLRDKGRIWTFDLNPVQQKNQYKVTLSESKELLRLLLRNNPIRKEKTDIPSIYVPNDPKKIEIDTSSDNGKFKYEGWLNAWFINEFAIGRLKDLFGDYHEFLNLVPTTFNRVMDIFLTHVTNIDGIDVLHKYSCIELKVNRGDVQDLTQLLRYEDWLARKLAAGDHDMVQSILVGAQFSDELISYVKERRNIEEKVVRLISYQIENGFVKLNELTP